MGYTTNFEGHVSLVPALTPAQVKTLTDLAETRHGGDMDEDPNFPSFYCLWVPSDDGTKLMWDGGEKFYGYAEWLQLLLTRYLTPWHISANGEITWHGEHPYDHGRLIVANNHVTALTGQIIF